MNRVQKAFEKKPIFIPFLTAGYPDVDTFIDLVVLLAEEGAGIVEIGVPFSDPVADGKVIQRASQKMLDAGISMDQVFVMIQKIRERTDVPIVLMSYYHMVMCKGVKSFVKRCSECKVDGLAIPDLTIEESDELLKECDEENIAMTFFLSQTTPNARMKMIIQKTTGFLYYVSRMGVTGRGELDVEHIQQRLNMIKFQTETPLALGFGISNPKDAKIFAKESDGIIVGSSLIEQIDKFREDENFFRYIRNFVQPFVKC
ncbi:tryptophan synthase subunit alpha [PVC group bacterium (ex Bugula neritina AB1)]|nr:tryptophan synthase subunit alpha [PVC group bacterium (ex Bugula neritina AB1)]